MTDWDEALKGLLGEYERKPVLDESSGVDELIDIGLVISLERAELLWSAWCRYQTPDQSEADSALVANFLADAMDVLGSWFPSDDEDDED